MDIEIIGKKQLCHLDHWGLSSAFVVWVWYDAPESVRLPDILEYMLHNSENCGLLTEQAYDTFLSKSQFKIDISPADDKKPHTDLHIACIPKKTQSCNDNWSRPYAMAGWGQAAVIMTDPLYWYLGKMVDCACALIIRQLTTSADRINTQYLTLMSLSNCWVAQTASQCSS